MIKAVLWDGQQMLTSGMVEQGVHQELLAENLIAQLLRDQDIPKSLLTRVIATGYGRDLLTFAEDTVTEITCHATGVLHLLPHTRTIIEIGGQDSKLIRIDSRGLVLPSQSLRSPTLP